MISLYKKDTDFTTDIAIKEALRVCWTHKRTAIFQRLNTRIILAATEGDDKNLSVLWNFHHRLYQSLL